jgi:outer membrane receptor protein involved in Fe transport
VTNRQLLAATALSTGAFITFASASAAAAQGTVAQATPVTTVTQADLEQAAPKSDVSIVVTGSRIRRPNLDSPVPVTSMNQEQLFETGKVAIGETLNELPQLRVSSSQQNGINATLGNAGLSLLDLRGLGTQRTLVLINGRRQVGSDIYGTASAVDVNTIPTALIERVDVVTGGNSAIYGSDAIAGVVNFILKRNFNGIDVRGQAGISEYSDANAYFASITAGHNFADGRGNIVVSAEYAQQDEYYGNVRPLKSQDAFITIDTDVFCTGSNAATCDPKVNTANSDGVPDRTFYRDVRSATTGNQGLVVFGQGISQANAALFN